MESSRRQLFGLADEESVGTRNVAGPYLWWLQDDIKEPITVQYPLLRCVRDHTSAQLGIVGVVLGVAAAIVILGSSLVYAYDVALLLVSKQEVLRSRHLINTLSTSFLFRALLRRGLLVSFQRELEVTAGKGDASGGECQSSTYLEASLVSLCRSFLPRNHIIKKCFVDNYIIKTCARTALGRVHAGAAQ